MTQIGLRALKSCSEGVALPGHKQKHVLIAWRHVRACSVVSTRAQQVGAGKVLGEGAWRSTELPARAYSEMAITPGQTGKTLFQERASTAYAGGVAWRAAATACQGSPGWAFCACQVTALLGETCQGREQIECVRLPESAAERQHACWAGMWRGQVPGVAQGRVPGVGHSPRWPSAGAPPRKSARRRTPGARPPATLGRFQFTESLSSRRCGDWA